MKDSGMKENTAELGKIQAFATWPACISAVSAVVYFFTSEGIRNYLRLLGKAVAKIISLIAQHFL
jgi:hypothetical protein